MIRWLYFFLISTLGFYRFAAADEFYCASRWRFSDRHIKYAQLNRVIDGDTFTVDISGLPGFFGKDIPVRIKGIDAAELNDKSACAKSMATAAQVRLAAILRHAARIDLGNIERDKYFRILADVRINDDVDVGPFMIMQGWVVRYDGRLKNKQNWCKLLRKLK